MGDLDRDDDGSARATEGPEALDDPDHPQLLLAPGAQDRELAAEPVAVLCRQPLADQRDGLIALGQGLPGDDREVVERGVGDRIDPEDRDRVRRSAGGSTGQERLVLDDRGDRRDPRGLADRLDGRIR